MNWGGTLIRTQVHRGRSTDAMTVLLFSPQLSIFCSFSSLPPVTLKHPPFLYVLPHLLLTTSFHVIETGGERRSADENKRHSLFQTHTNSATCGSAVDVQWCNNV